MNSKDLQDSIFFCKNTNVWPHNFKKKKKNKKFDFWMLLQILHFA